MSDDVLMVRDTPEEAVAAVRRGRAGWMIATRGPTGLWAAFDYVYMTKGDAHLYGRDALVKARDPERVAVLNERGERLRLPVPQDIRRALTVAARDRRFAEVYVARARKAGVP